VRSAYNLIQVSENCETCRLRHHGFFCEVDRCSLGSFDRIKFLSAHPRGAILFVEKEPPRGIFLLCQGEVKLSLSSADGKTLTLRMAKPGDVLGLVAAVTGAPYEATAQTTKPSQVAFVARDDFLRFTKDHPVVQEKVVHQIAASYARACEQLRAVGLFPIATRLARVLLEWSNGAPERKSEPCITLQLTHGEIGELIGTTRETVSRTLHDFTERRLITLDGPAVTIRDRKALEEVAAA